MHVWKMFYHQLILLAVVPLHVLCGSIMPQWTWLCRDDICKRLLASENEKLQSLATCNMLCAGGHLWPQPTGSVKFGTVAVPVKSESFSLQILASPSPEVSEYVSVAFELMKQEMYTRQYKKSTELRHPGDSHFVLVKVRVSGDSDVRLKLNTDESYQLTIRSFNNGTLAATITAQSFCGARHGLETLSQLVWVDSYTRSLLMLNAANIEDAPKFKYRGLLLDTARNYFPVADIMRTIDAMGANKLNTFHWHATDSQSFPLQLASVPQLALAGAYGPGAVYSAEEVRAVARRGRLRGVRVLLEVDAPAHVGRAWGWGPAAGLGPLALCLEAEPWPAYCGEPPCGQLNPRNPHVYDLLERIYREIIHLTGVDDVFHLGGHDISEHCWAQHFNDTDPMDLWLTFTRQALNALVKANDGKIPELTLLWSSKLTRVPYFLKKLVAEELSIQIESSSRIQASQQILNAGFKSVVISFMNQYYLDCGFNSLRSNSVGLCGPDTLWQQINKQRSNRNVTWRVEGGAACQWSEQLGAGGLDARLWPRAAALAERLWADRAAQAAPDVYLRLDTQRARLLARGLAPAPLWPRWCTHNPHACLISREDLT